MSTFLKPSVVFALLKSMSQNSQLPHTQGAIYLGCMGNVQDGSKFMTLAMMQLIVRYRWTQLPTPDTVIDRVSTLGANQPEFFGFSDCKGRLIGDSGWITVVDTTTTNTNGPPPSDSS
jgi:hypothetical protein